MSYSIPSTVDERYDNRVKTYKNGITINNQTGKVHTLKNRKNPSIDVKFVTTKPGVQQILSDKSPFLCVTDGSTHPRGYLYFSPELNIFYIVNYQSLEHPAEFLVAKIKNVSRNSDRTHKLELISLTL